MTTRETTNRRPDDTGTTATEIFGRLRAACRSIQLRNAALWQSTALDDPPKLHLGRW